MFNSHDEEHCGSLGEFEVRRLMKYMGTFAGTECNNGGHAIGLSRTYSSYCGHIRVTN